MPPSGPARAMAMRAPGPAWRWWAADIPPSPISPRACAGRRRPCISGAACCGACSPSDGGSIGGIEADHLGLDAQADGFVALQRRRCGREQIGIDLAVIRRDAEAGKRAAEGDEAD